MMLVLLCSCAESFIDAPFSDPGTAQLPASPLPQLTDGFAAGPLALRRSLSLTWPTDDGITSWCVSESQTQPPLLTCEGGQGPEGGWSATPPSEFLLSSGNGIKAVYTWVRDSTGTLLPMPSVAAVTLYQSAALIPMNEGSGNLINDLNGLGFFFQMGIGGTWGNRSVQLDGLNSYIDLGTPSELRFTSSFTITTWVKSAQAGGQILLGRYDPTSMNRAYHFHFTPTALQFEVSRDGSSTSGNSARVVANYSTWGFQNQWRHVAAVYESKGAGTSRVTLYVDGAKADENNGGPATVLDPVGLKVLIGISADLGSYPFKGQVGSTAFVAAALPQALVQAIYSAQRPFYLN
jgi:hypothetical protein